MLDEGKIETRIRARIKKGEKKAKERGREKGRVEPLAGSPSAMSRIFSGSADWPVPGPLVQMKSIKCEAILADTASYMQG